MKPNNAIEVQGLSKNYKLFSSPMERIKEFLHPNNKKFHNTFRALNNISFEVEKGTTFGIVGQNGSGKSTLLQLISGIIRPTSGNVEVQGKISALLELGAGFHREFTGRENVYLQGTIMGISRGEMNKHFHLIEEFADIGNFIEQPVKTYSSGMYIRLAFATSINVNPDVLIVDEVLAVGDDMFRRKCFRKIEEFREQGKTILFVSHSLPMVNNICNKALLLDRGEVVEIGTPLDITNIYSKLLTEREEKHLMKVNEQNRTKNHVSEQQCDKIEESKPLAGAEYRYGAGGAEIIDIEILNHENEKANIFEHGKEFTIRVKVLFKKNMKAPMVGFRIRTLVGIDVAGTNTILSNTPIGEIEPDSAIEVEFNQKMSLNPGSFALTSGVAEEISEQLVFHDRRMDVIVFQVIGNSSSGGLIDMNTSIQLTPITTENTAT